MRKEQVKTVDNAYAYMVDCLLANVERLALKKSRSESDFKRSIEQAKVAIKWAREFNIDLDSTRAEDVIDCNVEQYASMYDVKKPVKLFII